MLDGFKAQGLLKARGRQRTDSTAVLAAIRTLNRLECIGETLRHALNRLARAAPEWLRPHLDPAWAERYGPRFDEYRLPKGDAARQALAEQIGRDGFQLLAAIYTPDAPAALRALPAVEALRQVWLQQFYAPEPDGTTHSRRPRDLPPRRPAPAYPCRDGGGPPPGSGTAAADPSGTGSQGGVAPRASGRRGLRGRRDPRAQPAG